MTAVHDSPLKILRFASDELAAFIKKTRSHGTIAMHVGLAKRLRLAKNLPFSCSRVGRRPVGSRGRDASYLAPPRTDPYVQLSRIRLLPWVCDGKTLIGPRMKDTRFWEPLVNQPVHASP